MISWKIFETINIKVRLKNLFSPLFAIACPFYCCLLSFWYISVVEFVDVVFVVVLAVENVDRFTGKESTEITIK